MGYLEIFSDQDLKNTNLVLGVVGFGGAIVGLVVAGPAILGGVAIVGVASGWGQVAITEELRVRSGTPVNIDNSAFKFYILNQAINIPPAIISTIGPVAKIVPGMRLTAGTMQLLDGVGAYLGLKLGPVGIGLNAVDVLSSCDNSGQVSSDSQLVGVRLDDSSFTQKESFVSKLEPNTISIPRTDPNGYYVKITIKPGDGWDKLEQIYGSGIRSLKEYNSVLNPGDILELSIEDELRVGIKDKLRLGDKYISKIGVGGTYSDAQYATGVNVATLEGNNGTKATELQVGQNITIIEVPVSTTNLDVISPQANQAKLGAVVGGDIIMSDQQTKLADETVLLPIQSEFNSKFNPLSKPIERYVQSLKQEIQDTKDIAYLENQVFNFDDGLGYPDNIILKIDDRSYSTEQYVGDTA